MVGLGGLEPPTSRLSGVRSNRLSYEPMFFRAVISSVSVRLVRPQFAIVACLTSVRHSPLLTEPPARFIRHWRRSLLVPTLIRRAL